MQEAIEEIIVSFTEETGIECETVISSSGKLYAQIEEGAPYDIFVSADMKYPNALYKNGLTLKAPKVYAYGRLVLWTSSKSIEPSVAILQTNQIQHIAVANSKTAPYGLAAEEVLIEMNLYEKVKGKLVFGESISQTNQFILSESAEIGFTSKSTVLSPKMKNIGSWIDIDAGLHQPIKQGIVIVKHEKDMSNAQKFYDFLFSEKSKEILSQLGYSFNLN